LEGIFIALLCQHHWHVGLLWDLDFRDAPDGSRLLRPIERRFLSCAAAMMKAINVTRNSLLADSLMTAGTFWSNLVGLLGRRSLPVGSGLWLIPCQSVHTFGMHFPIDVLFLDEANKVIHLVETMRPFRVSRHLVSARSVLELPVDTVASSRTKIGDQIEILEA
jgi:uncharacterized protein